MMEPLFYLLPVIFIGGIISVVAGGGFMMILILIGSVFVDIKTTIVLSTYIMLFNQLAKLWHFRKSVDFRIVLWISILGLPSTYIGAQYLFVLPIRPIEILVSSLAILFIVIRVLQIVPHIQPTKLNLLFWGGVSGFLSGLVGNGALIRKPIVLSMGLQKELFIGTLALSGFVNLIVKVIAYFPHTQWTQTYVTFLCIAIPILFLAASIGKKLLSQISHSLFETFLYLVIVIGAVRLLFS